MFSYQLVLHNKSTAHKISQPIHLFSRDFTNGTALLHCDCECMCCSSAPPPRGQNLCRQMSVLILQGWNYLYVFGYQEKQIRPTKQNVSNPTHAMLNAQTYSGSIWWRNMLSKPHCTESRGQERTSVQPRVFSYCSQVLKHRRPVKMDSPFMFRDTWLLATTSYFLCKKQKTGNKFVDTN